MQINRQIHQIFHFSTLILLLIGLVGCENKPTLVVRVKGAERGWVSVLSEGADYLSFDSVYYSDGHFSYRKKNDSVALMTFFLPDSSTGFPVVATNKGQIELTISSDSIARASIKGDPIAESYYTFRNSLCDAASAHRELAVVLDSLKRDSMLYYQQLMMIDTMRVADESAEKLANEFIEAHQDSPYAALAIADYYSIIGRYSSFYSFVKSKAVAESSSFFLYSKLLEAARSNLLTFANNSFPNFSYYSSDGKYNAFSSIRASNTVVLLFFDPTDGYNRFVARQQSSLSEEFKEVQVKFLAIALSPDQADPINKIDTLKLKQEVGIYRTQEDPDFVMFNELHRLPQLYYISRTNTVQHLNVYGDSLRSILRANFPLKQPEKKKK